MTKKSLKARASKLSDKQHQLDYLSNGIFKDGSLPTFKEKLTHYGLAEIQPKKLSILQINIGYMCNQVCAHCHVDAGPDRKEMMDQVTLEACLKVMRENQVETVDLTGEPQKCIRNLGGL